MIKTEVKKLFLIINNCYPNFQIDDAKTETWLNLLRNVPFDQAQKNLRVHLETSSFVPTPADIIRRDPEQFTDYDRLRAETAERMAEQEEAVQLAVDCPARFLIQLQKGGGTSE